MVAWHKTPTTADIQKGVELAIDEVIKKTDILPGQVQSLRIGTTVCWLIFPLEPKYVYSLANQFSNSLMLFWSTMPVNWIKSLSSDCVEITPKALLHLVHIFTSYKSSLEVFQLLTNNCAMASRLLP